MLVLGRPTCAEQRQMPAWLTFVDLFLIRPLGAVTKLKVKLRFHLTHNTLPKTPYHVEKSSLQIYSMIIYKTHVSSS